LLFYVVDLRPLFRYIFAAGEHMANTAVARVRPSLDRITLEAALRARQLDRTLTTALPSLDRVDAAAMAPTGVATLDACLRGGLPRGQLSEMTGARSSGRTTLLFSVLAAATRRGEIAALVDTLDRLDVASAVAAGIDLERLLWVRGHGPGSPTRVSQRGGVEGPGPETFLDRALKACNLVLQARGFGIVALDLADVPLEALRGIPFTTWLRLQRVIEGTDTACVLVAPQPLARSAGGVTLALSGRAEWAGDSDRSRRVAGVRITVRVMSPRRSVDGEVSVATIASGA
jgi:recombination protein RecA